MFSKLKFRYPSLCLATLGTLSFFNFFYQDAKAQTIKRPELNILIDASGSMAEKIGAKTKMQLAQEALATLVNSFPDDAKVGLRAYGSQSDKSLQDCKDTKLLVPISTINKESIKSESSKLAPKGYTPISYSLEQAYGDFGLSDTQRYIVLISDGEETCGGDPCQTAKDLATKGVKTTINTVGFNVDSKTKEQLICTANATGGTYQDATNLDQLNEGLKQATKRVREFINYTAEGEHVVGGSGYEQATQLQAGTQYTSEILNGEELYYFLNIPDIQRIKTLKITAKQEQSNCHISVIKTKLFADSREDLNPSGGNSGYANLSGVDSKVIDVQFDTAKFDDYYKKSNKGVYFSISRESPFTCEKQVTLTIQSETQDKIVPTPIPSISPLSNSQNNQDTTNENTSSLIGLLGTGNRNMLLLGLAGTVILLTLGGIACWFLKKRKEGSLPSTPPQSLPSTQPLQQSPILVETSNPTTTDTTIMQPQANEEINEGITKS